jgi:hypothetical protein
MRLVSGSDELSRLLEGRLVPRKSSHCWLLFSSAKRLRSATASATAAFAIARGEGGIGVVLVTSVNTGEEMAIEVIFECVSWSEVWKVFVIDGTCIHTAPLFWCDSIYLTKFKFTIQNFDDSEFYSHVNSPTFEGVVSISYGLGESILENIVIVSPKVCRQCVEFVALGDAGTTQETPPP